MQKGCKSVHEESSECRKLSVWCSKYPVVGCSPPQLNVSTHIHIYVSVTAQKKDNKALYQSEQTCRIIAQRCNWFNGSLILTFSVEEELSAMGRQAAPLVEPLNVIFWVTRKHRELITVLHVAAEGKFDLNAAYSESHSGVARRLC